ncbi:uncharacterized protein [Montipora capricornis]|uniref:uncharacterized protein isoform X1 n=2 Tax=Montipora foliosa TaxID=591990 RepID=UPI0035F1456D
MEFPTLAIMFVSRVVFGAMFLTVWGRAISGRFIMDENENPGEPSFAALEENVCGGPCNSTTDCQCQSSLEICSRGYCIPFTIYLAQQNACPEVFKSECVVDEDCPCEAVPFLCEDNECVKSRYS